MKINKKDKILILLSGGQDSVVCLFDILSKTRQENVCAISYIYDYKNKQCINFAKKVCKENNIKHEIIDLSVLSSITKNKTVSGRNLFFLTSSALYAKNNGYNKIIIGLSKDDYNYYNDCRFKFVKRTNKLINYALEFNIKILAPYINKKKVEIWEIADKLNKLEYIYKNSYSCWKNEIKPCGICLSCINRENSYNEYRSRKI